MKEETFLARWSRLKAEVRQEPTERDAEPPETAVEPPPDEKAVDTVREPHPSELVDLNSLTFESDFTVFMQKGVPDDVKRQALGKLWTSDPVLANLDGLNDYDLDLSPHGHGPFTGTSWRIGEGFGWLDALEKLAKPDAAPDETGSEPENVVAVEKTDETSGALDITDAEPEPDKVADAAPTETSREAAPEINQVFSVESGHDAK